MKTPVFVLFISLLASCNVAEKAVKKYRASADFPKDCSTEFPIIPDTTFINTTDTLIDYKYYDSAIRVVLGTDTVTQIIQIPLIKTVTITNTETVTIVKKDSAAIEALRRTAKAEVAAITNELAASGLEKEKLAKELSEQKAKTKTRTKQRNYGFAALLAIGLFAFRKPLLGLVTGGGSNVLGLVGGLFRKKK